MKKVVLGFSGGLDTSFCVKYLTGDKGYEVHSIIVNTGGFDEAELKKIEEHAYKLGVSVQKLSRDFECINPLRPIAFGNYCSHISQ